jgi:hypothetical protein
MKEMNLFADGLFHELQAGVFRDQRLLGQPKVIGDQKGRFLTAMIRNNQLSDSTVIPVQFHVGFMDLEVPIFA